MKTHHLSVDFKHEDFDLYVSKISRIGSVFDKQHSRYSFSGATIALSGFISALRRLSPVLKYGNAVTVANINMAMDELRTSNISLYNRFATFLYNTEVTVYTYNFIPIAKSRVVDLIVAMVSDDWIAYFQKFIYAGSE